MIRAVIADDEPLSRCGIRLRLAEHPDIEIAGGAVLRMTRNFAERLIGRSS